MKLTYDPRYNIAYLQLQDKTAQVETVRVGEDLNIDLAPDGTVSGIEFLNTREQLFTRDQGKFILSDEARGKLQEVSLI
jgi:uncharacterized protein YuzE